MSRRLLAAAAALTLLTAGVPPMSAAASSSWDGLTRVDSKRFDAVYLLPGADFRGYSKLMLDPTEVGLEKNWLRDYNNRTVNLGARLNDREVKEMLDMVQKGFEETFRKAYADAGYQIVAEPGPDVLRVRTGVINLSVAAPDVMTAGRSVSFAQEAGHASLVIEVRDSVTNALLGRAVDSQIIGDTAPYRRNSVTNRSDFSRQFSSWAKSSVQGFGELKTRSPIGAAVAAK
jgi:hypothetical protein